MGGSQRAGRNAAWSGRLTMEQRGEENDQNA
jgi:hypothetical protein